MSKKVKARLQAIRERYDNRCRQLAAGAVLLGPVAAFAQTSGDGTVDVSDSLLKIAAGVAAALLVSAAMTAAILGIRSSKLPRRAG